MSKRTLSEEELRSLAHQCGYRLVREARAFKLVTQRNVPVLQHVPLQVVLRFLQPPDQTSKITDRRPLSKAPD